MARVLPEEQLPCKPIWTGVMARSRQVMLVELPEQRARVRAGMETTAYNFGNLFAVVAAQAVVPQMLTLAALAAQAA